MSRRYGFTLVELAIVLVIIGILVGMGAGLIGLLVKRAKYSESKEVVNAAVEGIKGFAVSYGRLPQATELNQAVRQLNDSYGKPLAYIYDTNLTSSSVYRLCGLTSTNLSVRICLNASCSSWNATINNVAFIVVSGDGNYNNQVSGTQAVSSNTIINVYEPGIEVDNYAGDINRTEPFDDIVKWVTLSELQQDQGCESLTIASPISLPAATEDSPYSYQLEARGGRPPYSWSGTPGCGLSLDSTGLITGTVNCNSGATGVLPGCQTQISFTATVTDVAGSSLSQNFVIPVRARPVEIITKSLPDAWEGSHYSAIVRAIGGDGSYSFSLASGSLPPGLNLSGSGTISGIVSSDNGCSENNNTYSFVVQVTSCSVTSAQGFSILVRDPDCISNAEDGDEGEDGEGESGDEGNDGSGGGSCPSGYTVHLIKSKRNDCESCDIKSVFINNQCRKKDDSNQSINPDRGHYTFSGVTSPTIYLYYDDDCGNLAKSYNLPVIDNNHDCTVYIACSQEPGGYDRCRTYNEAMVYCPKAKFYETGNAKRTRLDNGLCKNNGEYGTSGTVYVYTDNDCSSPSSCTYSFTQAFSENIDSDYDCKVAIDESCQLSNY